jgi:hypothetical protein
MLSVQEAVALLELGSCRIGNLLVVLQVKTFIIGLCGLIFRIDDVKEVAL